VSVETLSYRDSETGDYIDVSDGSDGFYLEGGYGPGIAGIDWPYEDMTLSPASVTRTTWPVGKRAVRIDGMFGFPRIPDVVKRANIDQARRQYRAGPGGGAQRGVNQFGQPVFEDGLEGTYYRMTKTPGSVYVKRSWRPV